MLLLRKIFLGICSIVLVVGGGGYLVMRASVLAGSINMSSAHMDHTGMVMMPMEGATPAPSAQATPITALVAPPSDAPLKKFTLTAQKATINIGQGRTFEAWTYNGTAPGPELRVTEGDLVEVELINQDIAEGVTIHWHGVDVPNAMDGVAGVTQDAIRPGEHFTYRFIAKEVGTYWYHSHQSSSIQVVRGLYGALVVEPKQPAVHYDRDYVVDLREWSSDNNCLQDCDNRTSAFNGQIEDQMLTAEAGELVRLRLLNSGQSAHIPAVIGAPVTVIALDGHDLNQPTPLENTRFFIGQAQRYDLSFRMPATGAVKLIDSADQGNARGRSLAVIIGQGAVTGDYPNNAPLFDFTNYGVPQQTEINANSTFDVDYALELGNSLGFYDGHFTMRFTINGKTNPDVPMLVVQPSQLIRIRINNPTDIPHPMHLHGHSFVVLSKNGKPLSGSPVRLDTIEVRGHESYDIAFRADNPGLWMEHCHILGHAARGMSMMIVYPNISTPFNVGKDDGNFPE